MPDFIKEALLTQGFLFQSSSVYTVHPLQC